MGIYFWRQTHSASEQSPTVMEFKGKMGTTNNIHTLVPVSASVILLNLIWRFGADKKQCVRTVSPPRVYICSEGCIEYVRTRVLQEEIYSGKIYSSQDGVNGVRKTHTLV